MKSSKDARIDSPISNGNIKSYVLFVLLVVISLFLGLLPTLSFGQGGFADPMPSEQGFGGQAPVSFGAAPALSEPPAPASLQPPHSLPAPTQASFNPPTGAAVTPGFTSQPPLPNNDPMKSPPPAVPDPSGLQRPAPATPSAYAPTSLRGEPRKEPRSTFAARSDTSGLPKEPTASQLRENPRLIHSVASPGHPFADYLALPKDPNSMIKGKPFSIAQLLEGVRHANVRRQLLQSYWELVGKLAEYNCRLQAEQQAAGVGTSRDPKMNQTVNLLHQQRRATEIEFVKRQWELVELLRRNKGTAISESELPIPTDFPLFKKYDTHVDKIARSERSRYVGRMIPIQEQLIRARHMACRETFEILNTIPPGSQQLLDMLNSRTAAFLDMAEAIVDYNKMIAEYASETIGPEISQYRLVGALVELPKFDPNSPSPTAPERRENRQLASPDPLRFSGGPDEMRKLPEDPAEREFPVAENRQNEWRHDDVAAAQPAVPYGRRAGRYSEFDLNPNDERPVHRDRPNGFGFESDESHAVSQAVMNSDIPATQNTGMISQVSHVRPQPVAAPSEAEPLPPKPPVRQPEMPE